MKTYRVAEDIYLIRRFYGLTQEGFAQRIGTTRLNVVRWENSICFPRKAELERVYSFAYNNGGEALALNLAKEMLYREHKGNRVLLFHGTDATLVENPDNRHSKPPNDFGDGFYLGQSLLQAATWVDTLPNASVYAFYFSPDENLKKASFDVDRRWMYAILYYRGALEGYGIGEEVKAIIDEVEASDFLEAPIADNQMYDILSMFKRGEITDEACIHSLSCTNLGHQIVLKSDRSFDFLECVDRFYLCEEEKADYRKKKAIQSKESEDKAKLARIAYRREGRYFDELFKRA